MWCVYLTLSAVSLTIPDLGRQRRVAGGLAPVLGGSLDPWMTNAVSYRWLIGGGLHVDNNREKCVFRHVMIKVVDELNQGWKRGEGQCGNISILVYICHLRILFLSLSLFFHFSSSFILACVKESFTI